MSKSWRNFMICLLVLWIIMICFAIFIVPQCSLQTLQTVKTQGLVALFLEPPEIQVLFGFILGIGILLVLLGIILLAFVVDHWRFGSPVFDLEVSKYPGYYED